MSAGSGDSPRVSVLMPTFKHAAFIRRAIESLRAQTLADWELVVVDDGSPDDTAEVIAPYLADPRVRYQRLPRNEGLGAALERATALARGRYLAYLPSDDAYYPDHLARLADLLDREPELYLAYGGVRWGHGPTLRRERWLYAPTLRGDAAVGQEAETLASQPEPPLADVLPSGNLLALVQAMHRRELEPEIRWPTRDVIVSDTLERDFWRALLERGARFAYAGAITCDWVDHPDQRHKIIAGEGRAAWRYGLSRYRAYYGVGGDRWLNWQPSRGMTVDERSRYGRFTERRDLPGPGGLKILLVGELGWNPERVLAFEERGHKLYALWTREPEFWDVVGPFPFGNIDDVPSDASWPERVRAIRPDVIYGLLNWRSLPLIGEVLEAGLGVPLVFHFKEGPFYVQQNGLWPTMLRILRQSAAQLFVNEETLEWFQLATDGLLDPAWTAVLDGDLPKAEWHTDAWAPKLSEADGEIHTVCAGRFFGLERFEPVAWAGIHVHFYGPLFYERELDWVRTGLATGHMHLHPMVEPEGWTRELSRYDAAWSHVVESDNGGDLRRAHWDDLNMPARLGTYATAGLPWILKDNAGSRVAVETLARRLDLGVFFHDPEDLAARLRDRPRLATLTANARAARPHFAFDTHADALIALFRRVIAER